MINGASRKRDDKVAPSPNVDNPYKAAIDATRMAVAQRLKSYRLLVVSVLATLGSTVTAAAGTWSLVPLSGIILLWPVFQLYIWLDVRVLATWRMLLIQAWADGKIALTPARETLSRLPGLPPTTLGTMLSTLPEYSELRSLDQLTQRVKEAAGHAISAVEARKSIHVLARALVTLVVGISLFTCIMTRSWIGLALLSVIPAIAAFAKGTNQVRWRRLLRRLAALELNSKDSHALKHALNVVTGMTISESQLISLAKRSSDSAKFQPIR